MASDQDHCILRRYKAGDATSKSDGAVMPNRWRPYVLAAYGALLAVPIGLVLAGTYDDDHDKASNVLLPIGLVMAAAGAALLAILTLIALIALAAWAWRRRGADSIT